MDREREKDGKQERERRGTEFKGSFCERVPVIHKL